MQPLPHLKSMACLKEAPEEVGGRRAAAGDPAPPRCYPDAGFQTSDATVSKIALFHYVTRSRQDFEVKSRRGGGNGNPKTWSFFDATERCA